jgi:uncharacterized protein (TIGR03790 family)
LTELSARHIQNFVQKYDPIVLGVNPPRKIRRHVFVKASSLMYIDNGIDMNRCSWHWTVMRRLISLSVTAVAGLLAVPASTHAQSAENVAVVINDNSPDSQKIGQAYAAARSIPDRNVLHIRTSIEETIDRDGFLSTIHGPLAAAIGRGGLHDRILYLVLTKGVPIRIAGTLGQTGTIASVDSELTLLYRRLTGLLDKAEGPVMNPYFLGDRPIAEARPFTHRAFDIFLVSRLDGFTTDEALALIDKATSAKADGRIVLDQRDALVNRTGDTWLELASKRLMDQGFGGQVVLETTPKPARGVAQVLGYFSWGSTDPQNRVRSAGLTFAPGALAATFVGSDARTFREPPVAWIPTGDPANRPSWYAGSPESLIGDLIRDGVTGAAGYVAQPFLNGSVRPQILFPAYVAGFNLVEAFYLAMPFVSWQTVVIGDPLCGPFPRTTLSPSEIDNGIDSVTGLPAIFSKRKLTVAVEASAGIPERAVALAVKAENLVLRGDTSGARQALADALEAAPRFAAAMMQRAMLDESAGRLDDAIEGYKQLLDIDVNNAVALNNLAFALAVHRKMPMDALAYAKRAVALAPMNPAILDTLGWIQHLLGDDAGAAKVMEQVVKTNTVDPGIRLRAAIVFAAIGARAIAQNQLAIALKLSPSLAGTAEVKQLQSQLAK